MEGIFIVWARSINRLSFKNSRNSMKIREIAKLWENMRNDRIVPKWRNRVILRNHSFQFKLFLRLPNSWIILEVLDPSFASISWSISGLPTWLLYFKLKPESKQGVGGSMDLKDPSLLLVHGSCWFISFNSNSRCRGSQAHSDLRSDCTCS